MLLRNNAAELREKKKNPTNQNHHREEVKTSACVTSFKLDDTITHLGIFTAEWLVGNTADLLTREAETIHWVFRWI